jgi:hypothetical protein
MTKKLLLPVLALLFATLCATTSSAQTCSGFTGAHVQYMGVGSSAQFNSFAFAAENLLNAGYNGSSGLNFWAETSFTLLDNRAGVTDTAKLWVAWDNSSDCYVYAYFSVDSTVGVKSFFAYQKETNSFATNFDTAAVFGQGGQTFASCTVGSVANAGQPACTTSTLPTPLQTFFTAQPAPTCSSSCTGSQRKTPLPYCGQNGTTALDTKWCFFNSGHADIRPEDTLYATSRALSAYNSTNGLTGLGYGNSTCGATAPNEGCKIFESFGQGGVFNVEKFAITGTDPFPGGGAVPAYVTLNVGAAPVVVFVNDADTAGFGAGAPSNYTITNINRAVLAGYEDGTFSCTGDISPSLNGAGKPVQVVQREPLSGTYNTFEFTAVRTLSGSAATAVTEHNATSTTWFSNDDSGQELNNDPANNYGGAGCTSSGSTIPTARCGDPLDEPTSACGSNGTGIKLRAIGTGEMVKATLDLESGQSTSAVATPDGLGYAFWGYGNFAKAASGCGTNSGAVTCTSYLGHYLTVDGVDPLFTNPGDSTNPNGAYHLPQCYLSSGSPDCVKIPFTHIYDGSYPLWTILRAVTFSTVSGSSGQTTPQSVVAMIAEAEKFATGSNNLDDFVPYFTNINSGDTQGDLNLGVFRSHYKQTNNPVNGFAACGGVFTGISLTAAAGGCTVDAGGDVGGSVFTVQSDVDFHTDFGSVIIGTSATPEIYGLHQ